MVSVNGASEVKQQEYLVKQNGNGEQSTAPKNVKMTTSEPEPYGEQTSLGNTTQKVTVKAHEFDYSHFGNKDKASNALSYATVAIKDVNMALANLQKNYPGANVDLEPFPNPQEFSKKQFGKDGAFERWKDAVDIWSNTSMTAINTYADKSHAQVTNDAADRVTGAVVATYADLKGGQKQIIDQLIGLGQLTATGFNQLMQKMDYDTNKVIGYVRQAANRVIANDNRNAGAIIGTVNQRAAELHEHMDFNDSLLSRQIFDTAIMLYDQAEGNKSEIKDHMTNKADEIKDTVTAKTAHINTTDVITKNTKSKLDARVFFGDSKNMSYKLLEKITTSGLPDAKQQELLSGFNDFIDNEGYLSEDDVRKYEQIVNKAIQDNQ